ncbi:MAG: S1 RNA-binding domain-containing protein [Brevinematales bacterium]|jgi:small subunit ribosomal protein S1
MGVDAMNDLFLEAMKNDGQTAAPEKAEFQRRVKKGKVVAVNSGDVFLDLGGKSECIVPLSEFSQLPSVGDETYVILKEAKDGVNIGSRTEAEKIKKTEDLDTALETGLPVSGTIEDPIYKDKVPKGFTVELGFGIKAFLPLSQIDVRKEEKLENLKGLVTDFAVIEAKRNNYTVSRREFLQKTIKKLYVIFFEKFKVGDVIHGKVERVEEDFIVLNAEGIRVFMHVSDFSWKYLDDMRKVIKLGDEMDVIIVRIDKTKNSVKVGRKQFTPDPWLTVDKKYKQGDTVKGQVISYRKDGAIVEIEDGIEGFLSNDEMSWTERIRDAKKFLKTGTLVEVKITNLEPEKRRMNVSLREIQENPWDLAAQNYSYGRKVEGTVSSILDFGAFIRFDDGIEGLMRREDVDWLDTTVDLKKKFKKGEKIQSIVLSLDKDKEKLRLGYKQLSDNPLKSFAMNYPKGAPVKAVIKNITDSGAVVSLENDLEGFIHISQISKDKVDNIHDVLKIGDEVQAVVRYADTNKNKIELSIKEFLFNEEKIEVSKYIASDKAGSNMASLGSILKKQLTNISAEK